MSSPGPAPGVLLSSKSGGDAVMAVAANALPDVKDHSRLETSANDGLVDVGEDGRSMASADAATWQEDMSNDIPVGQSGVLSKLPNEQHGTPASNEKPQTEDTQEASLPDSNRFRNHNNLTLRPVYIDPTPPTPLASRPPSRSPSNPRDASVGPSAAVEASDSPTTSDYDEKRYGSEDEQDGGSRSEIQSIMDQFDENCGPGEEEVMSPRLEITSPGGLLGRTTSHPIRASGLEGSGTLPDNQSSISSLELRSPSSATDERGPPVPPKDNAKDLANPSRQHEPVPAEVASMSPGGHHQPPLPEPEPEPALPFDFHRFLEQLRNKKADPVARYLKSFLSEFGKRQWMVHEQVKILGDFLAFIAGKMGQCDVWQDVSEAEFDNAREGMEKLVMNRLYTQTFSPAIPAPRPIPGAKPKRKGGERPMGPGRKGQHQEDVERDDVLAQKIKIYGWVREGHLDIEPVGDSGKKFLKLAQQELLKIRSYRAPRDKIICVLNCCKVIFGLLRNSKSDTSADSFMPLLIYAVLQANPEHLVSNVQYILRFRNQDKLGGEAGYYLSSLLGAIQFIENMDRTTLTISDDEFERNVEAAVSAIAEKHKLESPKPPQEPVSEKPLPRVSIVNEGESSHRRTNSSMEAVDSSDERTPITGLFRSIQRPLSSIGRIFSEELSNTVSSASNTPLLGAGPSTPLGGSLLPPRSPSIVPVSNRQHNHRDESPDNRIERHPRQQQHQLSAEEAAARQASAEAAEAQRLHRAEHANIVETLAGMFPDLDREIISDVVYQKQGRVGLAVDACLALSS